MSPQTMLNNKLTYFSKIMDNFVLASELMPNALLKIFDLFFP